MFQAEVYKHSICKNKSIQKTNEMGNCYLLLYSLFSVSDGSSIPLTFSPVNKIIAVFDCYLIRDMCKHFLGMSFSYLDFDQF